MNNKQAKQAQKLSIKICPNRAIGFFSLSISHLLMLLLNCMLCGKSHQRIGAVHTENRNIVWRCVVCHTNSLIPWTILKIVKGNNG